MHVVVEWKLYSCWIKYTWHGFNEGFQPGMSLTNDQQSEMGTHAMISSYPQQHVNPINFV